MAYGNTGNGWRAAPEFVPPGDRDFTGMTDNADGYSFLVPGGTRFADVNGDRKADMITLVNDDCGGRWGCGGWYRKVWLSTGTGLVDAPAYVPPGIRDATAMVAGSDRVEQGPTVLTDLNGDGLTDFITLAFDECGGWWGC